MSSAVLHENYELCFYRDSIFPQFSTLAETAEAVTYRVTKTLRRVN